MNKDEILNILEEEGLGEFDEIKYKKGFYILDAYYVFDKAEIEAAKAYANESYGTTTNDTWYDEYYFPYLYDILGDNIEEVLEEISEDQGINAQLTLCEMDIKVSDKCEVIIVFSETEFDIDNILEDIEK